MVLHRQIALSHNNTSLTARQPIGLRRIVVERQNAPRRQIEFLLQYPAQLIRREQAAPWPCFASHRYLVTSVT